MAERGVELIIKSTLWGLAVAGLLVAYGCGRSSRDLVQPCPAPTIWAEIEIQSGGPDGGYLLRGAPALETYLDEVAIYCKRVELRHADGGRRHLTLSDWTHHVFKTETSDVGL